MGSPEPIQTWQRLAAQMFIRSGIAAFALAVLIGPAFSPSEFDWVIHSTSEQAGQHMPGAWIMRMGFAAYGLGAALAAVLIWRANPLMNAALFAFGIGLLAAATWSNAAIVPEIASDFTEDRLHSIASAVVGTAFAAACTACIFAAQRPADRYIGIVGLAIAVFIPLAMSAFPDWRGVLQRAMFAFSFIFVWRQFSKA